MSKESFESVAISTLESIALCRRNELIMPALILTYAGIDTMAWLNRSSSRKDVTRADFLSWVDKYLLPGSTLPCRALELYAARCGVVHSYNPTSKLSREGKVREVFYAWGPGRTQELQKAIDTLRNRGDGRNAVAIDVDLLLDAFVKALGRFGDNLSDAELVYSRAELLFTSFEAPPPLS